MPAFPPVSIPSLGNGGLLGKFRFSHDQTRTFLVESVGVQILDLDEEEVVGWCDVTPLPLEGLRQVGWLGMLRSGALPKLRRPLQSLE